jgi:serine/threonine protein kinase
MGAVYLVERADNVFHKLAALKVIRPECMTPALLRRFQQERQILAELDHPNIARIIDGGTTSDGLPYFVMDYVQGEHLDRYCVTRRFSVDQKLRLFIQVCNAVQYLHAHRIIHRDLKPSNIVVTPNGNVKLLDFGIAKALSDSSTGNTKTTRVMTPGYASPEQIVGKGVTPASDVYALAILLYELLTGCRPFPGDAEHAAALMSGLVTRNPTPPSQAAGTNPAHVAAENPIQLRHRLEGDLDNIVLMALRNEPERRYQNAGELAADIERHLNGRPVFARKDSITYRAARYAQRNVWKIATAALIVALVIYSVWMTIDYNEKSRASSQQQNAASQQIASISSHQQQMIGRLQQVAPTGALTIPADVRDMELSDLRSFNDAYANSFQQAIKLKPGATAERKQLVEQGTEYLDAVRASCGNDPAVLKAVAQAYITLGDINGYPKQPNLGDRAAAAALYSKAQAALASLPPDDEARRLSQLAADHAAAVSGRG